MKNEKYYYNPQTLQYEKVKLSVIQWIWRIMGFVSTTLFTGFILMLIATSIFSSPKEKQLARELEQMETTYLLLEKQMDEMSKIVNGLEDKDNNIYRVIFEAEPISDKFRKEGFGNNERFNELRKLSKGALMESIIKKIERMERQLYVQTKSYDVLLSLIKSKEKMLSCIPAIQPISNKELKRISSGFGYRIDPIYKTTKFHEGLDFTAPKGTPIYVTGDGVVSKAGTEGDGYGNKVVVNHGYGYQTLYAHNSRIAVRAGQKVKRGEVIAYVGSTGKSTAPHLHYEVKKGDTKIDPINFFFNDLTPEEYEMVLKLAEQNNQSFD